LNIFRKPMQFNKYFLFYKAFSALLLKKSTVSTL
jgi:hypothetical protein